MIISTHKYKPKQKNGKLDKHEAMKACVSNFKREYVDTLDELYSKLYGNVVYSPIHWNNNHRLKANAILTVDLIMFDMDNGTTTDEVLNTLGTKYEIMVLKTASWSKELEKFRVFIPLKNPITFENSDHYREFYKVLAKEFNLDADENAMEAGRGFIAVKGREAEISASTEWLDLSPYYDKFLMKVKHKLQANKWRAERRDAEQKEYRRINKIKVPTPSQIQLEDRFREKANNCKTGENYSAVYQLLSYCKFRGQTATESADSVCLLNLDGEYSDHDDLINKYMGLK